MSRSRKHVEQTLQNCSGSKQEKKKKIRYCFLWKLVNQPEQKPGMANSILLKSRCVSNELAVLSSIIYHFSTCTSLRPEEKFSSPRDVSRVNALAN